MAKRLLLLRHAKAVPGEHGQADRDRALAARGHRDSALMAPLVADAAPDLVLCSPARRTRETLAGLGLFDSAAENVRYVDALYHAPGDYIPIIAAEGGNADCVLVVGHNPTIHATALGLADTGDPQQLDALAGKFPTAALAVLSLPISSWRGLRVGTGKLAGFHTPRELGGGGED